MSFGLRKRWEPVFVLDSVAAAADVGEVVAAGGSECEARPPAASVGDGVQYPPTNRGTTVTVGEVGPTVVPSQVEGHLDYLTLNPRTCIDAVRACFRPLFKRSWDDDPFDFLESGSGGRGFRESLHGEGFTVYWNPRTLSKEGEHICIEMKGSFLRQFTLQEIIDFYKRLEEWSVVVKVSRLDWAWDYVPFGPAEVGAAIDANNLRSNVHRGYNGWSKSHRSRKGSESWTIDDPADLDYEPINLKNPAMAGETEVIGTNKSRRQLCVYNGRGFNRCEFRIRHERCDAVARTLFLLPADQWSKALLSHLLQFCSFVDRAASKCVSRCPFLPWFADFAGSAVRASLKIPRVITDAACKLVNRVDRVSKQVGELLLIAAGTDLEALLPVIIGNQATRFLHERSERLNARRAALENELNCFGTIRFDALARSETFFCEAPPLRAVKWGEEKPPAVRLDDPVQRVGSLFGALECHYRIA